MKAADEEPVERKPCCWEAFWWENRRHYNEWDWRAEMQIWSGGRNVMRCDNEQWISVQAGLPWDPQTNTHVVSALLRLECLCSRTGKHFYSAFFSWTRLGVKHCRSEFPVSGWGEVESTARAAGHEWMTLFWLSGETQCHVSSPLFLEIPRNKLTNWQYQFKVSKGETAAKKQT